MTIVEAVKIIMRIRTRADRVAELAFIREMHGEQFAKLVEDAVRIAWAKKKK